MNDLSNSSVNFPLTPQDFSPGGVRNNIYTLQNIASGKNVSDRNKSQSTLSDASSHSSANDFYDVDNNDTVMDSLAKGFGIDHLYIRLPAALTFGLRKEPVAIPFLYFVLVAVLYLFFDYRAIGFGVILLISYLFAL